MASHDDRSTGTEKIYAALLLQWVKGAWESNDPVAVEDHFHPECVVTGMVPEVLEGVQQVRVAHSALCARLDHRQADVTSMIVHGEEFAGFMELEGEHRDTGIDVAFEVSAHGRMRDGLIYRCHNVIDYTGMYAKLGVLNLDRLREFFG